MPHEADDVFSTWKADSALQSAPRNDITLDDVADAMALCQTARGDLPWGRYARVVVTAIGTEEGFIRSSGSICRLRW
jgi:hypothetical protein